MFWNQPKKVVILFTSLPGCISEGDTFDGAMENIKEAFELYLEPDETVIPLMLPF